MKHFRCDESISVGTDPTGESGVICRAPSLE